MTNFNPGPGRVKLARLMRSRGHDGVLHVRTSGGAECVTEIDGTKCGARSNVWDSARHLDVWIRAHADEYEHKKFVKLTEEPANVYSTPATGQQ
ncbi:hypothetical protein [Streptomyces sp. NPDC007100]|uniref:DUF7848 domain-containing protein n=1 Tax=Streptomyces sp. NPDC007100 TaxID=3155602 RepID=UPI0033C6A2F1